MSVSTQIERLQEAKEISELATALICDAIEDLEQQTSVDWNELATDYSSKTTGSQADPKSALTKIFEASGL